MSQSLALLYAHITFSTKERFPFLGDVDIRNEMHAYLAGICKTLESPAVKVGGVADHVHVLCLVSKKHSAASLIGELKRVSSLWIKTRGGIFKKFHWQNGYGAFSIGRSEIDDVREYIEKQERHHQRRTFQDEFRSFLVEYGMEFDERYLWD